MELSELAIEKSGNITRLWAMMAPAKLIKHGDRVLVKFRKEIILQ